MFEPLHMEGVRRRPVPVADRRRRQVRFNRNRPEAAAPGGFEPAQGIGSRGRPMIGFQMTNSISCDEK